MKLADFSIDNPVTLKSKTHRKADKVGLYDVSYNRISLSVLVKTKVNKNKYDFIYRSFNGSFVDLSIHSLTISNGYNNHDIITFGDNLISLNELANYYFKYQNCLNRIITCMSII